MITRKNKTWICDTEMHTLAIASSWSYFMTGW